jgi:4-amino-4-deoxy-L-arabinose transferase-like glycosyltransferase
MASPLRRLLIGVRRHPVRSSVLAALAVMLPGLAQGDFSVDTGWYAAVALQSWRAAVGGDVSALWSLWGQGGDPGAGGLAYFNKPPLAFWLNGLPLLALGPSVLAARLGSVAAALLCVGVVASAARRVGGRDAALVSGLVLALTYEPFARFSHAFSLDLWLAAFVTGFFALAVTRTDRLQPSARWWLGAGVLLGLALMTKPFVALAAPIILAVGLLAARTRPPVGGLLLATVIALGVAAPWHWSMVHIHAGAFTDQYFGREVLDRASGAKTVDTPPAWFYLWELARGYWPWLAAFVLAGAACVRRWGDAQAERPRSWSVAVVGLVWVVLWLVLLSAFPDRRARYAAVAFPVAAIVCGMYLTSGAPAGVRRAARRMAPVVAVVAIALGTALSVAPIRVHRREPEQWTRFFAWYEAAGRPALYDGGMEGSRGARLYLRTGRWPRPMLDHAGRPIPGVTPQAGSLVMYHRLDLLQPGPGEKVEFAEGDLVVTRR